MVKPEQHDKSLCILYSNKKSDNGTVAGFQLDSSHSTIIWFLITVKNAKRLVMLLKHVKGAPWSGGLIHQVISLTAPRVEGSNLRRSSSFSSLAYDSRRQRNLWDHWDRFAWLSMFVYVKIRRHAGKKEEDVLAGICIRNDVYGTR